MFTKQIVYLGNYLWEKSIQNIGTVLTEQEAKSFTSNDYFYLSSIYYMNQPNLSEIARKHGVTKPAISAIVRKLMKLGLVEKIQCEDDKRFFYVALTKKGKNIIEGDGAQYAILEEQLKTLIADEKTLIEFENVVSKLVIKLQGGQEDEQKEDKSV